MTREVTMRLPFQIFWLLVIAALVGGVWWGLAQREGTAARDQMKPHLSLIHISEPTSLGMLSYAGI